MAIKPPSETPPQPRPQAREREKVQADEEVEVRSETSVRPSRPPTPLEERVRWLERKLQVVHDVATALGSTLDLDVLLATIMEKTTEVLKADRSTLYLLDEESGEIWSKVTQGGDVQEIRLKIPEGIAGWVAQSGETVNIKDAYSDERFNPEVDRRSGYRTRSMLTMAMQNNHGDVVGVVQVLNKRGDRTFDEEDEDLLRALTAQAAVSIENSKLYKSLVEQNRRLLETQTKLERRMNELDLLYQIEQESLGADSLQDLLNRLSHKAMDLVHSAAASVVLVSEDGAELFFSAATGPKGQEIRSVRVPRGSGVAGWVVEQGQPLIVADVSSDPRHNREVADQVGYHPRSILCVPLQGEDGTLGALELLDKQGPGSRSFEESDLKLASLMAGHMAKLIQLTRAREERLKESRLAAIGQMLSGVIHDLKTPLTIAAGYAQLLPSVSSVDQRERYGQEILKQFQLMDAMTREVISFARGDAQLLIRKVYLHRFIADIQEHLSKELESKPIRLVIDSPYQGLAYFDEIKMRRVVHNLATNATRAMPDGGTFTIRCERDNDLLRLSFSDTGTGIPTEMEGRLFDLFATSGQAGGTGLGLAIVRKIVSDHEGTIRYDSEPDRGTTFTVELPLRIPSDDEVALDDL